MGKSVAYHSCCYATYKLYPFGFCKKCWVKNGSPKVMGWNKRKVNNDAN